jgi:hypothetical protein
MDSLEFPWRYQRSCIAADSDLLTDASLLPSSVGVVATMQFETVSTTISFRAEAFRFVQCQETR